MADGADERLVVMLEARISEFEKRMAKAERSGTGSYNRLRRGSSSATRQMEADMVRSTSRINQALASTSSQVGSFAKSFAVGFAGGIVATALSGFSRDLTGVVRQIAQIGDEAKRAGVGVEVFQEWGYVARQNRIDIDALVDGFKELNLRADEFVVTGGGSAAEAFRRIGFSAEDLKTKLKDPSALMLEIIGRLEGLDKAAQIRIADELFGGTGGERFVELLGQGEEGVRKLMAEARSAGVIFDSELVKRADELDKRFAAIQERLATGFQKGVITVGEALFGEGAAGQLSDLMHDLERARAILGGDLYEALVNNEALVSQNAASISDLNQRTWELTNAAEALAGGYFDLADAAYALNDADTAEALNSAGVEMDRLVAAFKRGEINAGELAAKMLGVKTSADEAVSSISAADALELKSIIGEVGTLSAALGTAAGVAQQLWGWLGSIAGVDVSAAGGSAGLSRNPFDVSTGEPMTSSPRPQRPGVDSYGSWTDARTPRANGGGGGGGGGGKNEFEAALETARQQTAALEAEAVALLAAAEAGGDYAGAADYAKKKAELLIAAQKQGLTVTPELTAQIEEQARAYATAGLEAEAAAQRMEQIEAAAERGKDALGNIFDAIVEGGGNAREAIRGLLLEMAKVQFRKLMFGLMGSSGGGAFGAIGNLLSFEGGGETGPGVRSGGLDGRGGFLAMVHPNETITDHTRPPRGAAGALRPQPVDVRVSVDQNGNLQAFVDRRAAQISSLMTAGAAQSQQRALPGAINDMQRRGTR